MVSDIIKKIKEIIRNENFEDIKHSLINEFLFELISKKMLILNKHSSYVDMIEEEYKQNTILIKYFIEIIRMITELINEDNKKIKNKNINQGNENDNLCLSCRDCNTDKGDMNYDEYIQYKELNPYMPIGYHRRMALKILSSCKLYDERYVLETIKEERKLEQPHFVNVYNYDKKGELVGVRKKFVTYETVEVERQCIYRKLTKYGEIYNTICKLVNKPLIKTKEYL